MNLIYICVFHQEQYIELLHMLIRSIYIKANINMKTTEILIITSTEFYPKIQEKISEYVLPIHYYFLNAPTLLDACCARLHIFDYININSYDKILYLDTDILVNSNINILFDLDISPDKLYTLEEHTIGHETMGNYWGAQFFDFSKYDRETTAFTSGILYFCNSLSIRELFKDILLHIVEYTPVPNNQISIYLDQPFIVYNAIIQNKYDNQWMKKYFENNPETVSNEKIIYHFPGGVGSYEYKNYKMTIFWDKMDRITPVLFQTSKKEKMDDYVIDMIKLKLGNNWKYEYYNDDDIIRFFKANPIDDLSNIIEKFHSLPTGAHKADLFRYYYLYINGGVFMDSDAMIYAKIEDIVQDFHFFSVDSSCHPGSIFQGILGACARNQIIKISLYDAYNTDVILLENDYHYWCKKLYNILKENQYNFGYKMKLYIEKKDYHDNDNNVDILDETNRILFKHYWLNKIIPPLKHTDYSEEFTRIYNNNYWINGSGAGSYIENTILYNKFIIEFIKNNNIKQVTDIGCGDWQSTHLIYSELVNVDYLGIDCVTSVIEQNKIKYPQYSFVNMDILCNIDLIRNSELYIIKDVLQHWKLKDIYEFMDKLITKKYKYIIITNNGNQTYDNLELDTYIGNGRGLDCHFLPLKEYNVQPLLNYFGDENKHMCMITPIKIVFTTMYNAEYISLANITHKNKEIYCKKHNYPLVTKTDNWHNIPIGYEKAYLIKEALTTYPNCEWVFFSECDTLITNMSIKLEDIIKDEPNHFVITTDLNDINAGSFFIRNSIEGIQFLQSIIDSIGSFAHEQEFFNYSYSTNFEYKKWFSLYPQKMFNSYDYDNENYKKPGFDREKMEKGLDILGNNGRWQMGDFIIHFPAMGLSERIVASNYYTAFVIY